MDDTTVPIIEAVEITKIYGVGDAQIAALDQVSFQIFPGEFVAIMGPSGSGKSTLMNILACLDRPTAGRYVLAGEDVSEYDRASLAYIRGRELGFVFQSYNLLPRMTAFENVMMPMMYQHVTKLSAAEREEKAFAALEAVGLSDRMGHLPSELSGGQQQRIAIARALINDPIMILADEPTGNLDTHSSADIINLLHSLNEKGRTIVMVTHDADVARQTGRIIQIRDGKLASDQKHPLTRSTAGPVPVVEAVDAQTGGLQ
jgi:putative ABC transport system ATP-binding protein